MSIRLRNNHHQARIGGHSQTFDSREEAEKWIAGVRYGFLALEPESSRSLPTTIGELCQYVYDHRWSGLRSEEDAFRNGCDVTKALGEGQPVALLGERRVGELIRNQFKGKVSPATVNRKISALTTMIGMAYDLGIIDSRPTIRREREPEGRMRYLTESEEQAIVAKLPDDLADAIVFLIDTGMRVNEALSLQWSQVAEGRATLNPEGTKSKRTRVIPLTTRVMSGLMRHRDRESPFAGVRYRRLAMRFGEVVGALGLGSEVVLHTLRHTFASRLVQRGVDLYVVATLLGHKNISTTQRYSHLAGRNLDQAISTLQGSKHGSYPGITGSGDAGRHRLQISQAG